MEKYAQSDIRDGFNSLKIGIHNICFALKNKEAISTIELPFKVSMLILIGVIQEVFPDIEISCADSKLTLEDKDNFKINILIDSDRTLFYRD